MAVAIVLAGGSGNRMKSNVAKQYLLLEGKEVLYYSLRTFQENNNISDIVLVVRPGDEEYCRDHIVKKYGFTKVTCICPGGKERYDSVYNALIRMKRDDSKPQGGAILIHDGARPFITDDMIDESVSCVEGDVVACTVGVPVKDTIKVVKKSDEDIVGVETPDRDTLYQIQTPQTFRYDLLVESYRKMQNSDKHNITDDTMILEQYMGVKSKIIKGAYENIKITTPEDLDIGKIFAKKIKKNNKMC